jgi:hypothetical protein
MNRRTALAAIAGSIRTAVGDSERVPVLVELFTSEGCSSCPPADALLTHLERQSPGGVEVIALSEHVDYWNHLGWADAFSSPLFSARQQQYAARFRVESVYTPQMVINGRFESLGSDSSKIYSAIDQAAKAPRALVRLERISSEEEHNADSARVRVLVDSIPAILKNETFDVMLATTESGVTSSVSRGENAGRLLKHTGVVRTLTRIAEISPRKSRSYTANLMLPLPRTGNKIRGVLFLQGRDTQVIAGASSCNL